MADVNHLLSQVADEYASLQAQLDGKQEAGNGGRDGEAVSAAQDAELQAAGEPVVVSGESDMHPIPSDSTDMHEIPVDAVVEDAPVEAPAKV